MGYCVILLVKNMKLSMSILVALLVIATCSAKPAFEEGQGVAGAGCSVPEDCVGEMLWCDTEAGECKYGCDEQEDCPDGKICVIVNHASLVSAEIRAFLLSVKII